MNEFDLNKDPKIASGFKIPDGYFDEFPSKLMGRLSQEEPRVIPITSKKNWMYAAAAILVSAMVVPVYNTLKKPSTELDQTAIENYLANHTNISEVDYAELLDEKDIQNLQIDSNIEDKSIEDLLSTNSDLEEYLVN